MGHGIFGRWTVGGALGVLLLFAGCAGNKNRPAPEATVVVTSMQSTRQELTKAQAQVDEVLTGLDQLATAPADRLWRAYRTFTVQVSQTVSQADVAHRRAVQMRERGQQYINSWEKEAEQLSSPGLGTGATERRDSISENYDRPRDAARATEAAYAPFLTQLRDIQKSLSLDLTPAGVQAARPAFDVARKDAADLKQQIANFLTQIDQVVAVSPPPK